MDTQELELVLQIKIAGASHFQSYEFHDLSQFVHMSTNAQPPPPPPLLPQFEAAAFVVEVKLQIVFQATIIDAVDAELLEEEFTTLN